MPGGLPHAGRAWYAMLQPTKLCMHGIRSLGHSSPWDSIHMLPFAAVAVRWLEEPSPWRWPPEGAGPDSVQGIKSRFGPHLPAPASPKGSPGLHWARPGTLAFACLQQDASLQVPHLARPIHLHAIPLQC